MITDVEVERAHWEQATADDVFGLPGVSWNDGTAACVEEIYNAMDYCLPMSQYLDLGCGVGRLTVPLSRRLNSKVFGVDISSTMLTHSEHDDNVIYLLGDGRNVPEEIAVLDGAWSVLLFQHLNPLHVRDYIMQVADLLRGGARFHFQFCDDGSGRKEFMSYDYSVSDMAMFCEDVGLEVIDCHVCKMYDGWKWMTSVTR